MPGAIDDKVLPEDIVRTLRSMNWEKRLEKARAERARVLEGSRNQIGSIRPNSNELGCEEREVFEPSPNNFAPELEDTPTPVRQRTQSQIRIAPLVIGAMALGAFLQWGATQVLSAWRADGLVTVALASVGAVPGEPRADGAAKGLDAPVLANRADPTAMASRVLLPVSDPLVVLGPAPPPLARAGMEPDLVAGRGGPLSHPFREDVLPDSGAPQIEIGLFIPSHLSTEMAGTAKGLLTRDGTKLVAAARVSYTIRQTQVRYYHSADAAEALATAEALGGIVRDFTDVQRKPKPGRLEVYLAGSGGSQKPAARMSDFERFLQRLLGRA